ncbi:MAG: iron dicitrate transport regulator FecR, partial [Rhizorhabdus sp.]|nr:iron dicitrate transport regulator FecR [Rhizorhabdus sp.]
MAQGDANLREEAAGWLMRQRDPVRADWEAFTDWLEADPAHNAAYEAVALADAEFGDVLVESRGAPIASNDDMPMPAQRRRRLMPFMGAVAAVTA